MRRSGLPGAYNFTALTNDGKQSDQNIYLSGTIENQTTEAWHNLVRYGLTRKREQTAQWYPAGVPIAFGNDATFTNYYGLPVKIQGANGYSAVGQVLMNYGTAFGGVYPNSSDSANNRDQLYFQSDFRFTPHLTGLLGFRYMDERGRYNNPAFFLHEDLERSNYDYIGQFAGDFKNRLFYTLSGDIEKNQLYGTVGQPRIGLAYFPVRPGGGIAHGTKLTFNFSKGIQEPDLNSQTGSLQAILGQYGYADLIAKYNVPPIGGETSRSYDGGIEQTFYNERLLIKAIYFHNEFGNQIEFVDGGTLPLIGVSPTWRSRGGEDLRRRERELARVSRAGSGGRSCKGRSARTSLRAAGIPTPMAWCSGRFRPTRSGRRRIRCFPAWRLASAHR